jgi:hypothetical protein
MGKTAADAINDYLAPEQPDDCREASKAILVAALKSSGPVVHNGRQVSLSRDGTDIVVEDAPEAEVLPEEADEGPPAPVAHAAPEGPPRPAEETPLPDEAPTPHDAS